MIKLPNHTKRIKKTNEVLNNPYIGFTSFQHFRNDPLFSDCGPKGGWMKERYPVYDWVEQNGREQQKSQIHLAYIAHSQWMNYGTASQYHEDVGNI